MKEIFKRHPRYGASPENFEGQPDNLWVRCPKCRELLYRRELEQSLDVCPKCKHHFGIGARRRLDILLDDDSFDEYRTELRSSDPLHFTAGDEPYVQKLERYAQQAETDESFIFGTGTIDGQPAVVGSAEFKFAGGTMGAVFGERVVRAIELAQERSLPLILISSGGGARMQEGVVSLLQMAKTISALDRFKTTGMPYLSIMTDPCLGGITASYAMLGDVNLAEPGAYIGFAGRRVIEQTMRQKLPADAATAEFLQKHGMIDLIAARGEMAGIVARLLRLYVGANPAAQVRRKVEQLAGL